MTRRARFDMFELPAAGQSKPRWFVSRHALQRMMEMGLDRRQVVETLDEPDASWPAHQARRIAVRSDLKVVFDPASHVVVTVLWHTQVEWSRQTGEHPRPLHHAVA